MRITIFYRKCQVARASVGDVYEYLSSCLGKILREWTVWRGLWCYCFLRLIANNPSAVTEAVAMSIGAGSGTMNPGLHGPTRMLKKGVHTPDLAMARTSILGWVDGRVTVNSLGIRPMALPPRNGPKL